MECSEIVPQTQMTAPRMEEGAMTTARVMNGGLRGTKSATKREVNALSTIIRTAAPATVARIQCNATGIASQTHATETMEATMAAGEITARVMNGGLRGTKSATKGEVNALSTIIRTAAPATVARIQCNATGIASQTHATETTGEVGQEKGEENRENHPRESRIF